MRVPRATYRLQFNKQFTFAQAREIVDYLRELGISDCYSSPIFRAGPESTHGYDICGFGEINQNLGSEDDFTAFTDDLRSRGMGLLLDMVPNHMGGHSSNCAWLDVLEFGQKSRFAKFFDIDWRRSDKILLPVLGAPYGEALERGDLKLVYEQGEFRIAYYEQQFPVSPEGKSYLRERMNGGGEQALLESINGTPGESDSFDDLHRLLDFQNYRLAYWRIGSEELNYRRFFDVTSLVGVRMELPEVFEETHSLVFEWLRRGAITGLRIDHPDGLWNPREYCERLHAKYAEPARPEKLYVVVEKILSGDETLPADWPVEGTTGYDFLNRLNGIFVLKENEERFSRIYEEFTGQPGDFNTVAYTAKKEVLHRSFVTEHDALTHSLKELAKLSRYTRDFTFRQLHGAIGEVIAAFPVYRTYVEEHTEKLTPEQQTQVHEAMSKAKQSRAALESRVFDFIEKILTLGEFEDWDAEAKAVARKWVMRFQQLTGPATAKGLEDTAFYRFNRLVCLNEVGGEPGRFGISLEEFHNHNAQKATHWPHSLLASATHDTKRGEDIRARLNVLSELPEEWQAAVRHWSLANRKFKEIVNGKEAPSPNDEYLFYQTLLGAWTAISAEPHELQDLRERITAYMLKATKEAKQHTSWTDPDQQYEAAVTHFVGRVLDPSNTQFLREFLPFHQKIAFFGTFNSLAQVLIKATSPGVPDFYQGTELWDLSLVDPDNRRAVDYGLRKAFLKEIVRSPKANSTTSLKEMLEDFATGKIKLFTLWKALNFRRQHEALFARGDYIPLKASGKMHNHIFAFARELGEEVAVIIAPRFLCTLLGGEQRLPLGDVWADTTVHAHKLSDRLTSALTGEEVPIRNGCLRVDDIFGSFPLGLLSKATP
jgi:(1->4)-alpha-D-glucan 1-alpha-D-glucosylmutase